MAGEYDYPPAVPVHTECPCTVTGGPSQQPGEDCYTEIRNLNVWVEKYTETKEEEVENPSDQPDHQSFDLIVGIELEDYDEGVEAAVHWEPEYGMDWTSVDLPPHFEGRLVLQIEYQQMVCSGELWQVCVKEDPVAGVHTRERQIGIAGGMAIACTGIVGESLEGGSSGSHVIHFLDPTDRQHLPARRDIGGHGQAAGIGR
jgi:hypothetical protein